MLHAVTVYCSSTANVAAVYHDAARELGAAIVKSNWKLVYGGSAVGCMDTLANAVRAAGGKVIGITPRLMVDEGIADEKCDEFIVTDGMRQRKEILEQRGDAFIALPGGLGTLEEIFEIIVGRQLGYHVKPIVLLNVNHFYDSLLRMIDESIEQHFMRPRARELFFVANSVS